jgi:hypothetical protein
MVCPVPDTTSRLPSALREPLGCGVTFSSDRYPTGLFGEHDLSKTGFHF